uniref:ferroxidase n=1 Tax=Erpetoichthys calabaricus TaxID=27687 RepID=A0A8C4SAP0_ERPCA
MLTRAGWPAGDMKAAVLLLFLSIALPVQGSTRLYYLGIVETQWDYFPSWRDPPDFGKANCTHGLGSILKKAVYKQYHDASYSVEVSQPAWLGFLGPIIKAEVGDQIIIHLKNFASRPYSIHPHGVHYEKDSEGSLYPDQTFGKNKLDDAIAPSGSHTYTWTVTDEHTPTEDDPGCLTWIYHSHVDAPRDISSGLIGPLLTCKKGILDGVSLARLDVDKDFILMFMNVDENLSWYLDENIEKFCSDHEDVDKESEDFTAGNKKHSINGYMNGSLPGLEMCVGSTVSWHLFGMGSEADVHTAFFHGQTLTVRHQRTDVVSLFPATFVTANMHPSNAGKWLLSCQVNEHLAAGMKAMMEVKECFRTFSTNPLTEKIRHYYIAAKEVMWNYGPLGIDGETKESLLKENSYSEIFFKHDSSKVGGTYVKARYAEFTDGTFQTEKNQTASEKHLGILGPVIQVETGDKVLVTFRNMASRPYSIQPHGVMYEKKSEGTTYEDGVYKNGASVAPGQSFTYEWTVPDEIGPTDNDPQCLTRLYYSAVDPVRDTNSGLVGPLVVCRAGTLNATTSQQEMDKRFFLLFAKFDENLSWYLTQSLVNASLNPEETDTEDSSFRESNLMHAINGFMYANLPGLELCLKSNVYWHIMGVGSEVDIHGVVFQGNSVEINGRHKDSVALMPHTFATAFMQPDNVGTFGIVCQTSGHFLAGMKLEYRVAQCGHEDQPSKEFSNVRIVYIAAEELEWDYSPDRSWELKKVNKSMQDSYGHVFVGQEEGLIGSKYQKVVYREYIDGTFTQRKARGQSEEHLGILGPLIRAEVGDVILIIFKNKASRHYSIHAHGVQEPNKGNVSATRPGEIVTYRWNALERSGPGPGDSACLTWVYYSMVDPVKDLHSGLVGPLVICKKGTLMDGGIRRDIDRDFSLLFLIFDENQSWYLNKNVELYTGKQVDQIHMEDERFQESNKMHAINGKVYANLHELQMYEGERVDWYLIGLGQDIDMHTVHFHAETFTYKDGKRYRGDVFDLFPATFQTVEMVMSNPGTWLLHCHVSDHVHAGMETVYTVLPRKGMKITTNNSGKDTQGTSGTVALLGIPLSPGAAELTLALLFVGCIVLLIIIMFLVSLHCILSQQKKPDRDYLQPLSLRTF